MASATLLLPQVAGREIPSPGQHDLSAAQQSLRELEEKHEARGLALRGATAQARAALGGLTKPAELDGSFLGDLLEELEELTSAEHYVESLLGLQQQISQFEHAARELSHLGKEESGTMAFAELAAKAVDACAATSQRTEALKPLLLGGAPGVPPPLTSLAEAANRRVESALRSLRSVLSSAFEAALESAGWPPALGSPGGALAAAPEDLRHTLCELTGYLTEVQRSAEPHAFPDPGESEQSQGSPSASAPLWVAQLLAEPLAQRLRFHFAGGLDTDRADKPEWLLSQALRMAKELGPEAAVLDGALQACRLPQPRPLAAEVASGLRAAVRGVLATHYLPTLLTLQQPPLWLHLVDEICTFERQLAPLRGEPEEEEDDVLLGPPNWAQDAGSCMSAITSDPGAMAAWEAAELAEAQKQVDAAEGNEDSWGGPSAEWDTGSGAWRSEFWPPVAAESCLRVLQGLLRRASCLPGPKEASAFCDATLAPVSASLLGYMDRMAQTAANYEDLSSAQWAPKTGALCCAAHFLEHHVREASAACLPSAQQQQPPSAAAEQQQQQQQGPSSSPFSSSVAPCAAPERAAAAFGKFRLKWGLQLASAATSKFVEATEPYYLAAMSSFGDEGDGPLEEGAVDISPSWRPAVQALEELLARLSSVLDTVTFRETWRAAAMAINQILYDDFCLESQFSARGAQQFTADCKAITLVFKAYTPRPNAHFKELLEACVLLQLDQEGLGRLEDALDTAAEGDPQPAAVILKSLGVKNLKTEQVDFILSLRTDACVAE